MASTWLIVAAALGVDYGWQPLPQGGYEYVIQLEPEALDALRAGQDIGSLLPDAVRDVRGYRITVGRATLPRNAQEPAADEVDAAQGPVEVAALQPLVTSGSPATATTEAPAPVPLPYEPPADDIRPASDWQPSGQAPRQAPPAAAGNVPQLGEPDFGRTAPAQQNHTAPRVAAQDLRPRERTELRPADLSRVPMPIPPVERPAAANFSDPYDTQPLNVPPTYRQERLAQSTDRFAHASESTSYAPPPMMQPIAPPSGFTNATDAQQAGKARASIGGGNSAGGVPNTWMPLVVASLVLFVSLGSNLYLGWLTWSFRERCRRLAGELRRLRFSGTTTGT